MEAWVGVLEACIEELSRGAVEILTAAKVHCIPDVGVRMLDHDKIREKVNVMNVAVEPMLMPEYWDRDGLSVLPPQRCSKCRQCSFKGE